MKKILYSLVALVGLVLTSCNGDYDDWAAAQHNDQETAAEKIPGYTASAAAASIDLASITSDSVSLFNISTASLPAGAKVTNNRIVMKPTDSDAKDTNPTSYEVGDSNKVQVAALETMVENNYGRKPVERTYEGHVYSDVELADGQDIFVDAGTITLKLIPIAPKLADAYYYIGSATTSKDDTYKFSNGGKDMYDNPELSVTVPVQGGWHWFKIAPVTAFNNDGSMNWDNEITCFCAPTQDSEATEGSYVVGGNKYSWHMIEPSSAKYMKITIDVLSGTFKIEGVSGEYYMVGTPNNWKLDKTSSFFPCSDDEINYTSYFSGAWDCRICTPEHISASNWDCIGAETGNDPTCTKLISSTQNCMTAPAAGYYKLTVNTKLMTYSWTPVTETASCTYISLIGDFNSWGGDVDMEKVPTSSGADSHNWYKQGFTVTSEGGVKFRKNHDWTISWGYVGASQSVEKAPYAVGTSDNGANITVPAGTYNVYFNDITGQFYFIKQ